MEEQQQLANIHNIVRRLFIIDLFLSYYIWGRRKVKGKKKNMLTHPLIFLREEEKIPPWHGEIGIVFLPACYCVWQYYNFSSLQDLGILGLTIILWMGLKHDTFRIVEKTANNFAWLINFDWEWWSLIGWIDTLVTNTA